MAPSCLRLMIGWARKLGCGDFCNAMKWALYCLLVCERAIIMRTQCEVLNYDCTTPEYLKSVLILTRYVSLNFTYEFGLIKSYDVLVGVYV